MVRVRAGRLVGVGLLLTLAAGCGEDRVVDDGAEVDFVGARPVYDPFPWITEDAVLGGEAAIAAYRHDLPFMEQEYRLEPGALERTLRHDPSLRIDRHGRLLHAEAASFGDGFGENPTPDEIPAAETFKLHSKPDAAGKIYLDFKGGTVYSSSWGTVSAGPFSTDADPAFNADELLRIRTIWLAVAEDYAAFDVDITTEEPVAPDMSRFLRMAIWPTDFAGQIGGICFTGVYS